MSNKIKILIIVLLLIVVIEGWVIYRSMNVENLIMLGTYSFNNLGDYISANGTWISDTELAYPVQESEIICLKNSMICTEAIGQITDDGLLFVKNILYDIDTWNEKEIITKPDDYACARYIMRFDLIQEQVIATRTTTSTTGVCEHMSSEPIHMHLGDGYKIQNR